MAAATAGAGMALPLVTAGFPLAVAGWGLWGLQLQLKSICLMIWLVSPLSCSVASFDVSLVTLWSALCKCDDHRETRVRHQVCS